MEMRFLTLLSCPELADKVPLKEINFSIKWCPTFRTIVLSDRCSLKIIYFQSWLCNLRLSGYLRTVLFQIWFTVVSYRLVECNKAMPLAQVVQRFSAPSWNPREARKGKPRGIRGQILTLRATKPRAFTSSCLINVRHSIWVVYEW